MAVDLKDRYGVELKHGPRYPFHGEGGIVASASRAIGVGKRVSYLYRSSIFSDERSSE
jgi:hypothetical protein